MCRFIVLSIFSRKSHANVFFKINFQGATDGKVSQLERLVFSENFVKEETEDGANSSSSPATRLV